MKQTVKAGLLVIGALHSAVAQVDLSKLITGNQTSPEMIAAIHYGAEGKLIWIFYHAPSVRDPQTHQPRHIFNGPGALQADGTIWRLGADYATVLHSDADLDIGGLAVPKGDYTLYVDLDKGNWKLIVNKQLTFTNARGTRPQWGIVNSKGDTTDDPAKELGRTALTMGKPAAPVETLKIALVRTDETHGKLEIAWENVAASVPFTVK
ncbi:MAG TPA: DUF2911 domain-containing protein [Bryobacteraceae bacterium]|nr:DUF2911 domain-containing protein [Bryobacteraceae bacterium]